MKTKLNTAQGVTVRCRMNRLFILAALALAGCTKQPPIPQEGAHGEIIGRNAYGWPVQRIDDEERGVSCYTIAARDSLSCVKVSP